MARITWTDPTPVDGTTVLTSARWEQLKTDITAQVGEGGGAAGNIDAANMVNGFLTRVLMASGNQDVIQAITVPMVDEVVATTRLGFAQTNSSAKEFYGGLAKTAQSLLAIDYVADEVVTNACTVRPVQAGVAVGSTDTLAVSATPQIVEREMSAISFTDGQRFGVNVQGSGGTSTVIGGFATLYFQRTLA